MQANPILVCVALQFSNEMRQSYKEQHPNASVTQISSGLGEMWQSLTENEKKVSAFPAIESA